MTPAQSMVLADIDDEHPESGFAGHVNSTAPARPAHHHSNAEDEGWDVQTLYARLAPDWRTGILNEKPTASPHPDFIVPKWLTDPRREGDVTTSPFTAEPSKREGAETALPLSVIHAKQPGSSTQNVSAPEVDGRRLADASTVDDVLDVLRDCGHTALAAEIDKLVSRLADEPDEPPPNPESLKLLARAAFGEDRLCAPRSLALSKEGYLHAEWYFGQAKLFMTFLPTAHIRVVAVHPGTGGDDALHVAGSLYSPNTESLAKWLASSLLK